MKKLMLILPIWVLTWILSGCSSSSTASDTAAPDATAVTGVSTPATISVVTAK